VLLLFQGKPEVYARQAHHANLVTGLCDDWLTRNKETK